jgi:hypothetical protein
MDGQNSPHTVSKEGLNNAPNQEAGFTGVEFENSNTPPKMEASLAAGNEIEQAISSQETQPMVAPPSVPAVQQPQPIMTTTSGDREGEITDTLPNVAGHGDRIEKQWVVMGEKIIEQTKSDPRQQKDKIDSLRDAYQSARYGAGKE